MITMDAQATHAALQWPDLVDALRDGFRDGCETPVRHHHDFDIPGEAQGTLLLMPAWIPGRFMGLKTVIVVPENGKRGLPGVNANYILSDGKTGQQLALIDGAALTNRRTAAASALASTYLSNPQSSYLLVAGTGALAHALVAAHSAVRPITTVWVWGRSQEKAEAMAKEIRATGQEAAAVTDLKSAAQAADIVTCATMSMEPLIEGQWMKPGCHLDLVGAFKPDMRESDDDAMRIASIFVDTRAGALKEAGDIVQPIADGVMLAADICGDLFDLAQDVHPGRTSASERTVFKSVGTALEDLYAAILVYEGSAK